MTNIKNILFREEIHQSELADQLELTRSEINRRVNNGINKVDILKKYCIAINKILKEEKYNWWELAE